MNIHPEMMQPKENLVDVLLITGYRCAKTKINMPDGIKSWIIFKDEKTNGGEENDCYFRLVTKDIENIIPVYQRVFNIGTDLWSLISEESVRYLYEKGVLGIPDEDNDREFFTFDNGDKDE